MITGCPKGGGGTLQEASSLSAVGNVVVTAVRLSVALTQRLLNQKVDMLVDSGLSVSLIRESVATAYSRQIERAPKGLQLTSAKGKETPVIGCIIHHVSGTMSYKLLL